MRKHRTFGVAVDLDMLYLYSLTQNQMERTFGHGWGSAIGQLNFGCRQKPNVEVEFDISEIDVDEIMSVPISAAASSFEKIAKKRKRKKVPELETGASGPSPANGTDLAEPSLKEALESVSLEEIWKNKSVTFTSLSPVTSSSQTLMSSSSVDKVVKDVDVNPSNVLKIILTNLIQTTYKALLSCEFLAPY